MRVLILGGTGFIGQHVVARLQQLGHTVAIFHRGHTTADLPAGVQHIVGDREQLATYAERFRQFVPDMVLDTIAYTEHQAETVMQVFAGITSRLVVLSSIDVYWAYGRHHRTEAGPIDPRPLTEDSPLRQQLYQVRGVVPRAPDDPWRWLDDLEKIVVEHAVMQHPELAGTILRLPMVYGPGTSRLFAYLKRMDDQRPAILVDERGANWRGARGYVENVAAAIALAVTSDCARGQIYNVAELNTPTEVEWIQQIAAVVGWQGTIVPTPQGMLPYPADADQHWIVDSTRIRRELGYSEVVTHQDALERTVAWERAHPPERIDSAWFGLDYASEEAILTKLK